MSINEKKAREFSPRRAQWFYVAAGVIAAVAALVGVLRVEDVDALVAVVVAIGGLVGAGTPFWAASNVHEGSRSRATDEDLQEALAGARAAEHEITALRGALGDAGETVGQAPAGGVEVSDAPAGVDEYESAGYRPEEV